MAAIARFALILAALAATPALADFPPAVSIHQSQVASNAAALSGELVSPQGLGQYRVGRQTTAYVDFSRDNRLLVIDIWYPVTRAGAAGAEPSSYGLVFASLESEIALDSPPVADDAEFPLLVFSHGNLGIRFQSFFLMEALASHGYVVVAMDHAGNTAQDLVFDTLETFEESAFNRPIDVSFIITRMLERDAQDADVFFGSIDEQRIGVFGHSFGGYTALATASGIDGVAADTRVTALAPIAPASGLLADAQLQSIVVPTLILGGTADITTPVVPQSSRPFELLSSPQRTRVDLVNAGHQSFTNICVFTDTLLDAGVDADFIAFLLGNAAEGCAPELMPIEQAHDLSVLYTVAFMKAFVSGDPRYARYLTPQFAAGKQLPVTVYVP